ncbi:MAG: MFS transporter [Alphaproteobacteria bacterium]|nr:MFS transporter [Alphaproteobacteria bacterium]
MSQTRSERLIVALLVLCQSLFFSGVIVIMTLSALVGDMLAENKTLTTLPLAVQMTATMVTTVPASMAMGRFGRKAGFVGGLLIGAIGAGLAAASIILGSFLLFIVGSAFMGSAVAVGHFFRFAAADTASPAFRPKAISYVMAGGVVAALLGPELAKATRTLLPAFIFAGCFVAIGALWLATILPVLSLSLPKPKAADLAGPRRPLSVIARQPMFIVAVVSGMVGYAVMTLVMTATPLAMVGCGFAFTDAALVIQWHSVGMFAPSFVTGSLISRFGIVRILLAGAALLALAAAINLSGLEMLHFLSGLVLIGIGWNFLYVGGSTLVTETYAPAERAAAQGLNDFLVFSSSAAAAFSSGALQHQFGWEAVNLGVLPVVAVSAAASLWLATIRKRAATSVQAA